MVKKSSPMSRTCNLTLLTKSLTMNKDISFRNYQTLDQAACLSIFDANCPDFFALNERDDYLQFLESCPAGYELCVLTGKVVGAFGVFKQNEDSASLNWILLDPTVQGQGVGARIMERVNVLAQSLGINTLHIAASHRSAPFFEKFGALPQTVTEHGWGPDMHRVDMALHL